MRRFLTFLLLAAALAWPHGARGSADFTDGYLYVTGKSGLDSDTITLRAFYKLTETPADYNQILTLADGGTQRAVLQIRDPANGDDYRIRFLYDFTTTDGVWLTNDIAVDSNWHELIISYDRTATANNPVLYVDGASVALNRTAPVGTANTGIDEIYLGATAAGAAPFDIGLLASIAEWNVIVPTAHMVAMKGFHPSGVLPADLVYHMPLGTWSFDAEDDWHEAITSTVMVESGTVDYNATNPTMYTAPIAKWNMPPGFVLSANPNAACAIGDDISLGVIAFHQDASTYKFGIQEVKIIVNPLTGTYISADPYTYTVSAATLNADYGFYDFNVDLDIANFSTDTYADIYFTVKSEDGGVADMRYFHGNVDGDMHTDHGCGTIRVYAEKTYGYWCDTAEFVDSVSGDDANDGYDALGFDVSGCTWTHEDVGEPGGTLVCGGTPFSGYSVTSGDVVYLISATAAKRGWYLVTSTNGTTTITVDGLVAGDHISSDQTDVASSDGPEEHIYEALDSLQSNAICAAPCNGVVFLEAGTHIFSDDAVIVSGEAGWITVTHSLSTTKAAVVIAENGAAPEMPEIDSLHLKGVTVEDDAALNWNAHSAYDDRLWIDDCELSAVAGPFGGDCNLGVVYDNEAVRTYVTDSSWHDVFSVIGNASTSGETELVRGCTIEDTFEDVFTCVQTVVNTTVTDSNFAECYAYDSGLHADVFDAKTSADRFATNYLVYNLTVTDYESQFATVRTGSSGDTPGCWHYAAWVNVLADYADDATSDTTGYFSMNYSWWSFIGWGITFLGGSQYAGSGCGDPFQFPYVRATGFCGDLYEPNLSIKGCNFQRAGGGTPSNSCSGTTYYLHADYSKVEGVNGWCDGANENKNETAYFTGMDLSAHPPRWSGTAGVPIYSSTLRGKFPTLILYEDIDGDARNAANWGGARDGPATGVLPRPQFDRQVRRH